MSLYLTLSHMGFVLDRDYDLLDSGRGPEVRWLSNKPRPTDAEIAAAARNMVQASLQQWLSPRIEVRAVAAEARENLLAITVQYRRTDEENLRTVSLEHAL